MFTKLKNWFRIITKGKKKNDFIFKCPRCDEILVMTRNKLLLPTIYIGKREKLRGDVIICHRCKFKSSGPDLNCEFMKWTKDNGWSLDMML